MSEEVQAIGQVTHYFDRIGVAALKLWDTIHVGDWIHFYGAKTNFVQQIESMQINHQSVQEAYAEDDVGLKVIDKVRPGDWVYPHVPPAG
jgi:putative protease